MLPQPSTLPILTTLPLDPDQALDAIYNKQFNPQDEPLEAYLRDYMKAHSAEMHTNRPLLLQWRFLYLCVKETYLYKPCTACVFEQIFKSHTVADHLKAYFFEGVAEWLAKIAIQPEHTDAWLISYHGYGKDEYRKWQSIANLALSTNLPVRCFSMAFTIGPYLNFQPYCEGDPNRLFRADESLGSRIRRTRHEAEAALLKKIRILTASKPYYIRVCADYRGLGTYWHGAVKRPDPAEDKILYSDYFMHSVYYCDCRGCDFSYSCFYDLKKPESSYGIAGYVTTYFSNVMGADFRHAKLIFTRFGCHSSHFSQACIAAADITGMKPDLEDLEKCNWEITGQEQVIRNNPGSISPYPTSRYFCTPLGCS